MLHLYIYLGNPIKMLGNKFRTKHDVSTIVKRVHDTKIKFILFERTFKIM